MDFALTEEQRVWLATVTDFAQRELSNQLDVIEGDRRREFPWENWRRCASFGLHGLPIPEEYGGAGADMQTNVLTMETLGKVCRDNGLIFAINAQICGVQFPILAFGSEEQKHRYLPGLCKGEIVGAHALSEPDAGSDALNLRTRALNLGDHYLLEGCKTFVTNAPIADIFLIYAKVQPEYGLGGITGFLVDRDASGLRVSQNIEMMGLRTALMGQVYLDNCKVPASTRLGEEGGGAAIFHYTMARERACIMASYLGTMEWEIEECIGYVKNRKQFGSPIGKFQLVAAKIADMKVRLETARLMLYKVGWLLDQGKSANLEAAIAKLYTSECLLQSSLDALQIHGGYGYTSELGLERIVRDAIGSRIYSGTSEIQRLVIARLLGL